MTVTENPKTATAAPVQPHPSLSALGKGRGLAILVAALAVLTTGTVLTWMQLSESPGHTSRTVESGNGFQSGGSIYNQQVPAFIDWSIGYGPDSATYREQVPSYIDWAIGYGPGSATYDRQVPAVGP